MFKQIKEKYLCISTPDIAVSMKQIKKHSDTNFYAMPDKFKLRVIDSGNSLQFVDNLLTQCMIMDRDEVICIQDHEIGSIDSISIDADIIFGIDYTANSQEIGELTLSRLRPVFSRLLRSRGSNGILGGPRSTLITEYILDDTHKTLCIMNCHILDSIGYGDWLEQIGQIFEYVALHQGPIVIVGNFHTNKISRLKSLKEAVDAYGLTRLSTFRSSDSQVCFYRGVKVIKSYVSNRAISTSKHLPLTIEFAL